MFAKEAFCCFGIWDLIWDLEFEDSRFWPEIRFKIWDLAWRFKSPVKKIWDFRERFDLRFAHHCSVGILLNPVEPARRCAGNQAVLSSWPLAFCLRRYPPSEAECQMLVLQGPCVQYGHTEIRVDHVRFNQWTWLTNQIVKARLHWRHV